VDSPAIDPEQVRMGLVVIATRPTLISGHHRTDTSEDDEQLEADLKAGYRQPN